MLHTAGQDTPTRSKGAGLRPCTLWDIARRARPMGPRATRVLANVVYRAQPGHGTQTRVSLSPVVVLSSSLSVSAMFAPLTLCQAQVLHTTKRGPQYLESPHEHDMHVFGDMCQESRGESEARMSHDDTRHVASAVINRLHLRTSMHQSALCQPPRTLKKYTLST